MPAPDFLTTIDSREKAAFHVHPPLIIVAHHRLECQLSGLFAAWLHFEIRPDELRQRSNRETRNPEVN
jgi:hypothetical protein